MSEKKIYEQILEDQERLAIKERSMAVEEEVKKNEESVLNKILVDLNVKRAQELQDAYEEYRQVRIDIIEEKGGVSLPDVKEKIPDNLFVKVIYSDSPLPDDLRVPIVKNIREALGNPIEEE